MSAFEWFAIGLVCFIAGLGVALTLLSINHRSAAEDAEQRRAVSRPAELGSGDDWSAEQMRKDGLI